MQDPTHRRPEEARGPAPAAGGHMPAAGSHMPMAGSPMPMMGGPMPMMGKPIAGPMPAGKPMTGPLPMMGKQTPAMGPVPLEMMIQSWQIQARGLTRYIAQPGDTLASIAQRFRVPPGLVQQWNWMPSGDSLIPGTMLTIPAFAVTGN